MAVMPNMGGFVGAGHGNSGAIPQLGETGGILTEPTCGSCPNSSGVNGRSVGVSCIPGNSYNQMPNCTVTPINPISCLSAGTTVLLPEGQSTNIEDLKKGDFIVGIDCAGNVANQLVKNISIHQSECVEVEFDSHKITCSTSHMFIGIGVTELYVKDLQVDDKVLGLEGAMHTVKSITPVGVKDVVAIHVVPNHMFVAEGIVHHNKLACAEPAHYY